MYEFAARPSELLNMRLKDVSDNNTVIYVNNELYPKYEFLCKEVIKEEPISLD
jgi:integrase